MYYKNFKGDKERIVTLSAERQFTTIQVGNREDTYVDSEAKFFEFAAKLADDNQKHNIVMFSEKSMCPSCLEVMNQFKQKYPNVSVNVVSFRKDRSEKSRKRNSLWERRYEYENRG